MKSPMKQSRFKALALLSGGLDSILAVKVIQEQGIEVEAVHFISPFFHNHQAGEICRKLGVKLHSIDISADMLRIVQNPAYGFGKNLNPCVDCHLNMVKRAGEMLKEIHADFLVTGEVLGERGKSQNLNALNLIAARSGFGPLLLRPLSAKRLEPTEAEKKGMVDRERLLDLAGRKREAQIGMAGRYGVDYFPQPAGGCLLTDPGFCGRLRPSLKMNRLEPLDIELLKVGRHFMAKDNVKIIVSRDEEENQAMLKILDDRYFIFELDGRPGPLAVLCAADPSGEQILRAASLTVRYSRYRKEKSVPVKYYRMGRETRTLEARPRTHQELDLWMI